ncbi:unnamed protein product, partial [Mesorhabditis spiculigera]
MVWPTLKSVWQAQSSRTHPPGKTATLKLMQSFKSSKRIGTNKEKPLRVEGSNERNRTCHLDVQLPRTPDPAPVSPWAVSPVIAGQGDNAAEPLVGPEIPDVRKVVKSSRQHLQLLETTCSSGVTLVTDLVSKVNSADELLRPLLQADVLELEEVNSADELLRPLMQNDVLELEEVRL